MRGWADRPERLLTVDAHLPRYAGQHRGFEKELAAEVRARLAPGHHIRAGGDGLIHVLAHLGRDLRVVERPHRDALMQRVAKDVVARMSCDALGQLVGDAFVGQHAAGRGADLSSIRESAVGRGGRRALEVGVLEHEQRAIAAEFEQHGLAGAALRDAPPGRRTAGEADPRCVGMRDDLVADDRPFADHEIEDASRKACGLDRSHELDGGHRSRRRRNPHDCVAGGESGPRYSTGMFTG